MTDTPGTLFPGIAAVGCARWRNDSDDRADGTSRRCPLRRGTTMTTAPSAPTPVRGSARDVVDLACRAPSIHNTQPWSWRVGAGAVELFADRDRRLHHADPAGRDLMISCGSALHHAQVAARGLGWEPHVTRHPVAEDPDLLARIDLVPGRTSLEAAADLKALVQRCTDRRRFTAWPVPGDHLGRLCDVARSWGAAAVAMTDLVHRLRVEHLVSQAYLVQAGDPLLAREHELWLDHSADDGVPAELVPAPGDRVASRRPRFERGVLPDGEREVESSDGLLVLVGEADDEAAWLATGEALGAVWLSATRSGLSVVPLSQVIEVAETRLSLEHDVLLATARPHLLLRVGWQELGRRELLRTPRRPLDEVLRV